ncbi:MAG: CRISPR-associated helicase Cas3' [Deinococcales bacterium]
MPEPARSIAMQSAEDIRRHQKSDRNLELVARAWFEQKVLRFDYYTADKPDEKQRKELEIYFVEINRDNLAPYAIGYERLTAKKILTFKLSRMSQSYVLEDSYEIPQDFDPRRYLSAAWGIMGGEQKVKVCLRFAPEAKSRILEGGYPQLDITSYQEDGAIIATLEVGADNKGFAREILPWIQSWGPRVEVLEPKNLRERWLAEACEVALKHPHLSQMLAPKFDANREDNPVMTNFLSPMAQVLWAKSTENGIGYSLMAHMLDVAAVAKALLEREPSSTQKLYAQDLELEISEAMKWVSALAGLHDIGKATPDFQKKWPPGKLLVQQHLKISNIDSQEPHGLMSYAILRRVLPSYGLSSKLSEHLADAVGAHHGIRFSKVQSSEIAQSSIGDAAWREVQEELCSVFLKTLEVITISPPQAQSLSGAALIRLAGLTSFADWIGSSQDHFPPNRILNDPRSYFADALKLARQSLQKIGWHKRQALSQDFMSFQDVFPKQKPRELQTEVANLLQATHSHSPHLILIEAPMGEGKTEAAFYAHLLLQQKLGHRGMYVALPTQATGNAMFERAKKFLASFNRELPLDLQLLHGAALLNQAFSDLQLKEVNVERYDQNGQADIEGQVLASTWFSHRKRALLSEYGVGTVDQALLSILNSPHHFVRLWGLANRTVIIDEVHAYELYTSKLIERLVMWLRDLGSSVIIMSATLPLKKRQDLLAAFGAQDLTASALSYPRISHVTEAKLSSYTFTPYKKQQSLNLRFIGDELLELAQHLKAFTIEGGCAVAILNTVDRAQKLYQALGEGEAIFSEASQHEDSVLNQQVQVGKCLADGIEVYLFHARYPAFARQKREEAILKKFGKEDKDHKVQRPSKAILIATQVVEQSLDLDFDVMLSDLAPIDLILQRSGRLHRHERERPKAHEQAVLYIACRLKEGQILPDIEHDYHHKVYDAFTLYQSYLSLRAREVISLPEDMDTLIETVYGDAKIASHLDDQSQVSLQKSLEQQVKQLEIHKAKAEDQHTVISFSKFYPKPESIKKPQTDDDDDNPHLHEDLRATTRLGKKSITVIPLHKLDGKLYLDRQAKQEVMLDQKTPPSATLAKEIYLRHVKLSRWEVIKAL